MKKTKLVNLLRTFSKQEAGRFKEFVSSPFFNKNNNVIRLYDDILAFHPGFDSADFTEEKTFTRIFPNDPFDYFRFKNIVSDLYQLGISFLTLIANEKSELDNNISLLNELHERRLERLFSQTQKKVAKELGNIQIRDELYHYHLYKFAQLKTSQYKFKGSTYTFDLIQNEFDCFLNYSLIGLLKHYSKMLTNRNHGNISFRLEMFDEIWNFIKSRNIDDNPQSLIYRQIIAIELDKREEDYSLLKKIWRKYSDRLSREDKYFILLSCNSYVTFRLKQGDERFYKDRFEIFREMIEEGFIPYDYILFVNFISFFTSACVVGEFEWAEDFVKKFSEGISPKSEAESTLNYCKGFKAFTKKDYDSALGYLSKTKFKLFLAKVMVKSYTLRSLYEKGLYDQTLSGIETFRKYLKSEKLIADEQKQVHHEFLRILASLIRLNEVRAGSSRGGDLRVMKNEIMNMQGNPLGAKNWLLTKVNDLH
jgi:hypothetical protein